MRLYSLVVGDERECDNETHRLINSRTCFQRKSSSFLILYTTSAASGVFKNDKWIPSTSARRHL